MTISRTTKYEGNTALPGYTVCNTANEFITQYIFNNMTLDSIGYAASVNESLLSNELGITWDDYGPSILNAFSGMQVLSWDSTNQVITVSLEYSDEDTMTKCDTIRNDLLDYQEEEWKNMGTTLLYIGIEDGYTG